MFQGCPSRQCSWGPVFLFCILAKLLLSSQLQWCTRSLPTTSLLTVPIVTPPFVCPVLTATLTLLVDWLDEISLLLSATKTQVMILKPRGNDATSCVVKCRDTVLELTQTAKYYGVIINDKLTWQNHADHLSTKCDQAT